MEEEKGSVTLFNNEPKNKLCAGFAQEMRKNLVLEKVDRSPRVKANEKVGVNITSDKGRQMTAIQEFYRGTNIFITGGTGCMGKVLIEKLLRSCPHINMIYMLVRRKKGKDVNHRVQELFQDPLFDHLRNGYPNFGDKIQIISGDFSEPGLGLNTQDRAVIMEHIHIVFNLAATVRFDEKLEIAIPINVRGTRDLLVLCRDCRNMKAMIHVSTAYSHSYQTDILEEFYDVPITGDKAIKMVEALDEKILTSITPLLVGKWPNTYTFTKAIAEDVVRTHGKSMCVGIFRPSIVVCTRKEPIAGWIDNVYGPTGTMAALGMGILRVGEANSKFVTDIVPCDMTISALIASAWDVHKQKSCGEDDILIYNYISSQENPITVGEYIKHYLKHNWEVPLNKAMWKAFIITSRIHIIFKLYAFFLHILPALLIDGAAYCIGQKPKLLKTYSKIHRAIELLSYFVTRQWKFSNLNIQQLWQKLSPEDRIIFDFNISDINWDEFGRHTVMGIRTYLLKEDSITLPDAIKRRNRLFWLHQFTKLVFLSLLLWLLWGVTSSLPPISIFKPM